MFRSTRLMSDDALRGMLRERRLAAVLTRLVARQRESAELALAQGEWEAAAAFEESSALATHRLGQLEDAMLAILQGHRQG